MIFRRASDLERGMIVKLHNGNIYRIDHAPEPIGKKLISFWMYAREGECVDVRLCHDDMVELMP